MIFLMYNMGNSGGSWFERVCNSRNDIRAWEELHRQLKYEKVDMDEADKIALDFIKQNIGQYTSVGLIKSFGKRTVSYCLDNGGIITQMYRNPIKVINHKMGKKTEACKKCGIECSDIFTAHIRFYKMRYEQFLSNSSKYPTFRLEDLSASIIEDRNQFSFIMKSITGVDWNESQILKAVSVYPLGRSSFEDDRSDVKIWNQWDQEKRKIFLHHFESIMKKAGYSIPL